jgi:hypothetical protein
MEPGFSDFNFCSIWDPTLKMLLPQHRLFRLVYPTGLGRVADDPLETPQVNQSTDRTLRVNLTPRGLLETYCATGTLGTTKRSMLSDQSQEPAAGSPGFGFRQCHFANRALKTKPTVT